MTFHDFQWFLVGAIWAGLVFYKLGVTRGSKRRGGKG